MHNFDKVFKVFQKNYKTVPLEKFSRDPYQVLISVLLSSRTKDEVTFEAAKRLFKRAPNINLLSGLGVSEIRNLIYPVGFYKTKSIHLARLAKMVIKDTDGEVPKTRNQLLNLPGVGRKTANLVLNRAFNIPAIAVDTHVHRISNLLGWVKTKTPQKTEDKLTKILPKKYWSRINRLFVSIGRQFTTQKRLKEFLKKNKLI